jgi:hypothetical protein
MRRRLTGNPVLFALGVFGWMGATLTPVILFVPAVPLGLVLAFLDVALTVVLSEWLLAGRNLEPDSTTDGDSGIVTGIANINTGATVIAGPGEFARLPGGEPVTVESLNRQLYRAMSDRNPWLAALIRQQLRSLGAATPPEPKITPPTTGDLNRYLYIAIRHKNPEFEALVRQELRRRCN